MIATAELEVEARAAEEVTALPSERIHVVSALSNTELSAHIFKMTAVITRKLKTLRPFVEEAWRRLGLGQTICECTTKAEFAEKILGRSTRAVEYMLVGGNDKRSARAPCETISHPAATDPAPGRAGAGVDEVRTRERSPKPLQTARARGDYTGPSYEISEDVLEGFMKACQARNAAKARGEDIVTAEQRQHSALAFISAARRALAALHHPDKGGTHAVMAGINETADYLIQLVEDA